MYLFVDEKSENIVSNECHFVFLWLADLGGESFLSHSTCESADQFV